MEGDDWLKNWPSAHPDQPLARSELVMALFVVRDAMIANYEMAMAASSDPASLPEKAKMFLDADSKLISFAIKISGSEAEAPNE